MISLATIVKPTLVRLPLKAMPGVDPQDVVVGMANLRSEADLPVHLLTSMSKMNPASLWLTIKLALLAVVVLSTGDVVAHAQVLVMPTEAPLKEEAVVALLTHEVVPSAAEEEAGGIGRRYGGRSLYHLSPYLLYSQSNRTRESSVAISPEWSMLEEIEFHRLAKLRMDVDDPEDLYVHNSLALYVCTNKILVVNPMADSLLTTNRMTALQLELRSLSSL